MSKPLKVYNNILWSILDEGSQLYILDLLITQGFKGDVKIESRIIGDTTRIIAKDDCNHELELPINILDILNS